MGGTPILGIDEIYIAITAVWEFFILILNILSVIIMLIYYAPSPSLTKHL